MTVVVKEVRMGMVLGKKSLYVEEEKDQNQSQPKNLSHLSFGSFSKILSFPCYFVTNQKRKNGEKF